MGDNCLTSVCWVCGLIAVSPLLAGWLLDKLLGDPQYLPHPVVGFGKMISFTVILNFTAIFTYWDGLEPYLKFHNVCPYFKLRKANRMC